MKNYINMKRNQWKVKATLYGYMAAILDNRKDIVALAQNFYTSFKDVPAEELKDALMDKIAQLAHNND